VWVLGDLRKTIYFRALMPDEDTYHRWAVRIADATEGAGYAPDFPRLPARIFAAVYAVFGVDTMYLRVFNLLLGVAICAIAYFIGRSLYGRGAGLAAALLCAFSKGLVFHSATVMSTCLGLTAFALAFAVLVSCLMDPERHLGWKVAAFGGLCGLLANLRPNAAIIGVLIIPVLLLSRTKPAPAKASALRVLQLGILCGGVYLASAALAGSVSGPRFGYNLYIGNNPDNPSPYFRPVRFTSSAPEHQSTGFVVEAGRRADRKLSPDEAEAFWTESVLEDALARPGPFLAHLAQKALAIVHASPADNNHDLRFTGSFVSSLRWAFLPSWLLLALGTACLAVLPFDRRLLIGAGAVALYSATIVAFFAGERLRAPLLLLAAPYAGAALSQLCAAQLPQRRMLITRAGLIVLVSALAARVPVACADDLSGPYNMHALMLFGEGDLAGAEHWYRGSLALGQLDSPGARIGLAAILQKRGRSAEAVAMLEPLPDSHYEAASKHEWLGNLALGQRRLQAAIDAYETSLAIDSSRQNAYKGLYIAYRLLGEPSQAAAADDRLQRILSFE